MKKQAIAFSLSLLCGALLAAVAIAQTASQTITEQDAHAIAVDACLYFYSLVDVTRKQLTNVEPAKLPGRGPMNMFNNVPTYPSADDRSVVRVHDATSWAIAVDRRSAPHDCGITPDPGGKSR